MQSRQKDLLAKLRTTCVFLIDLGTSVAHISYIEDGTMMDSKIMRARSLEEIDGSRWATLWPTAPSSQPLCIA
jgi:hypothetical protein